MATVKNTLIGRASGSVGQVVFLTYRLENVMRAKPTSVYNPNTIPQQTARNKYGYTVFLYRAFKPIIDIGFSNLHIKKSRYNAFMQENVNTSIITGVPPVVQFFPYLLAISKGSLMKTSISFIFNLPNESDLYIFYSEGAIYNQRLTDILYIAYWNETQNHYAMGSVSNSRDGALHFINVGINQQTGDILHVWSFFTSIDKRLVSDTVYTLGFAN